VSIVHKIAAASDGSTNDPERGKEHCGGQFGGFLVVGSLSKTSVAMAAGAHTQLANLVAAVFCFLTLVFLTPLFRGMPHPALAAIVIAAMLHLSRPDYLRELFSRSRWEFVLAAIVIAAELTLGVPHGITVGVALSLVMLVYRTSHPQGARVCCRSPSKHEPVAEHASLAEHASQGDATERCELIAQELGKAVAGSHRFQNPCDEMRNARLKREDAFSHAMIIVSSAMVSSS